MPTLPARAPSCRQGVFRESVLAALLAAAMGCGTGGDSPAADAAASRMPDASSGETDYGYPRTLTGSDGVALRLAAPPRRIVPASAGLVDLACALLPPERLAGLPGQALAYSSLRDEASPYLARPRFEVYNAEAVLALEPDLVLADVWQARETTERLRGAGVPVLVLDSLERLEQAEEALGLLASAFGTEAACAAYLADLRARADALGASSAHRREWRALSYVNGGTGGWVAGAGTTPDEWITLTGMRNAAAGLDGHARCSFEQLLELDPDLIVVSGRAAYDDMGGTAGLLRREAVLADLVAVREERIVVLDAWLYNTLGLHSVDAAEVLAESADAVMTDAARRSDDR
ncbi:MAG: ABC transporter substrate-binding protein [Planctomycetota bacterium]|jgi:iron complex transport system substrate-binding protein